MLSNAEPAGCAFPAASVLIEPLHLRQDLSRQGDIYALGTRLHRKDFVMDVVVTFAMTRSCLSYTSKSSDHAIRKAENGKFRND